MGLSLSFSLYLYLSLSMWVNITWWRSLCWWENRTEEYAAQPHRKGINQREGEREIWNLEDPKPKSSCYKGRIGNVNVYVRKCPWTVWNLTYSAPVYVVSLWLQKLFNAPITSSHGVPSLFSSLIIEYLFNTIEASLRGTLNSFSDNTPIFYNNPIHVWYLKYLFLNLKSAYKRNFYGVLIFTPF